MSFCFKLTVKLSILFHNARFIHSEQIPLRRSIGLISHIIQIRNEIMEYSSDL